MNANTETINCETATSPVESPRNERCYLPQVDVLEAKQELILRADVPGARADAIDIDYENGRLTIQARVEPRDADNKQECLLCEYGVGNYCRSFNVGDGIDADAIQAELTDGVLSVHLPKAGKLMPRKIAVGSTT